MYMESNAPLLSITGSNAPLPSITGSNATTHRAGVTQVRYGVSPCVTISTRLVSMRRTTRVRTREIRPGQLTDPRLSGLRQIVVTPSHACPSRIPSGRWTLPSRAIGSHACGGILASCRDFISVCILSMRREYFPPLQHTWPVFTHRASSPLLSHKQRQRHNPLLRPPRVSRPLHRQPTAHRELHAMREEHDQLRCELAETQEELTNQREL
ncbi:hypothetical protein CRG98_021726 [Punica granatum]|uniref:Uncharacterized protein n=1 Tax=Punica granatum TaxID=22663 RepID=A0A2I0JNL0_PUNGR|nr:hypothetical protein CRG98_021726 [Punica granatum]